MKRTLLLLTAAAAIFWSSCKKDETCTVKESNITATQVEIESLLDSLEKYGIHNTMQHPAGFYYKINEPGPGNFVSNLCSTISAKYRGHFFNGVGFDSSLTRPISFTLGQLIVGWQKAIPLVKEGGKIDVYIPPSLAYGPYPQTDNSGKEIVPANSYLVFEIEVVKIQ